MSVAVALQVGNVLRAFDTDDPGATIATIKVRGLQPGENLLGIDFRPSTNQLYALGSSQRLYTIDVSGGAAAPVGGTIAVRLNGTEFGFDFDPAADLVRVVSDADQNLRIDPDTGEVIDADIILPGVQADPDLAYSGGMGEPAGEDPNVGRNPGVIALAYANNVSAPATPAAAYGIDAVQDVLVRQGSTDGLPVSADTGELFTVGALGLDVQASAGGLDIVTNGTTDVALAALSTEARRGSQLLAIDLATGAATPLGRIGRGRRPMLDLAVVPAGTSFFVATARRELIGLNTAVPGLVLSRRRMTGFGTRGERVVGVDVRPLDGRLWALTDADRLYVVDTTTGVATPVGGVSAVDLAGLGMPFGFDFDPAGDHIRVTNAEGQNVRFDPATGAGLDSDPTDPDTDPDPALAYAEGDRHAGASPQVVGSAFAGAVAQAPGTTTLYAIDADLDLLATQGSAGGTPVSPSTGRLFTVGPTTVDVPDRLGFDIGPAAGGHTAIAVFAPRGSRRAGVYSVNVATGALTSIGGLSRRVRDVIGLAIVTGP